MSMRRRTEVESSEPAGRTASLRLATSLAALFLGTLTAHAEPTAREILDAARVNQTTQHRTLEGRIRNGGERLPFSLKLEGDVVEYRFANPPQTLTLKLGTSGGSLAGVPGGDLSARLRGTDITYEDLTLNFLYWPSAAIEGEQKYLSRTCWKIAVEPGPKGRSQYSRVQLLIDQGSGALMRATGYDAAGNAIKRFEVRSVQKVDGGWILKQMRVEGMGDGQTRDREPTYLEIEG